MATPVTIEELLISNLAQSDAIADLLVEKGLITTPFADPQRDGCN